MESRQSKVQRAASLEKSLKKVQRIGYRLRDPFERLETLSYDNTAFVPLLPTNNGSLETETKDRQ